MPKNNRPGFFGSAFGRPMRTALKVAAVTGLALAGMAAFGLALPFIGAITSVGGIALAAAGAGWVAGTLSAGKNITQWAGRTIMGLFSGEQQNEYDEFGQQQQMQKGTSLVENLVGLATAFVVAKAGLHKITDMLGFGGKDKAEKSAEPEAAALEASAAHEASLRDALNSRRNFAGGYNVTYEDMQKPEVASAFTIEANKMANDIMQGMQKGDPRAYQALQNLMDARSAPPVKGELGFEGLRVEHMIQQQGGRLVAMNPQDVMKIGQTEAAAASAALASKMQEALKGFDSSPLNEVVMKGAATAVRAGAATGPKVEATRAVDV